MIVTPKDLLRLAGQRHTLPWNWTAHFCAAVFGLASLYFHSGLVFSAGLVFAGIGFLDLSLPMPDGRWRRFVLRALEFEDLWMLEPWGWRKFLLGLGMTVGLGFLIWGLWARDLAALGLLAGVGVLIWCVRDNIAGGIDP